LGAYKPTYTVDKNIHQYNKLHETIQKYAMASKPILINTHAKNFGTDRYTRDKEKNYETTYCPPKAKIFSFS
jgi:hypothetical protein